MKKILLLTSNTEKCGIYTYTYKIFKDIQGVSIKPISLKNFLTSPFKKFDVIHIQHEFGLFDKYFGISALFYFFYIKIFSVIFNYKIVTTVHSIWRVSTISKDFNHIPLMRNRIFCLLVKMYLIFSYEIINICSDKVIILTEVGKKVFKENLKLSKAKTIVIPIPVETKSMLDCSQKYYDSFLNKYNIQKNTLVLTEFGFAYRNKGFHLAIESLSELKKDNSNLNIKLFIIAGVPSSGEKQCVQYLAELEKLTDKLLLTDNVFLTGFLEWTESLFSAIVKRTNLFIFPYHSRTSGSGAINDVISFYKPIIASNIDSFAEFDFLLKFEEGNVNDLSKVIVQSQLASDFVEIESKMKVFHNKHNVRNIRIENMKVYND